MSLYTWSFVVTCVMLLMMGEPVCVQSREYVRTTFHTILLWTQRTLKLIFLVCFLNHNFFFCCLDLIQCIDQNLKRWTHPWGKETKVLFWAMIPSAPQTSRSSVFWPFTWLILYCGKKKGDYVEIGNASGPKLGVGINTQRPKAVS